LLSFATTLRYAITPATAASTTIAAATTPRRIRRAGGDLIITRPKYAFAIVPVPDSESFGGAPLVVRASDPDIARAVVEAAGTVLGEMRIHEDLAL
jgi:hypothetical protein